MSTVQTKFERVATTENGRIFKNADLVRHLLGFESVEEAMLAIEPSFPDEGDRTAFITIANMTYSKIKKQEKSSDYAFHIDELPDMVWDTFQEYKGLKGTDRDYNGSIRFEAWIAKKLLRMGENAYVSGPTNYDHFLYSNDIKSGTKSGKQMFLNNGKGNLACTDKSVEILVEANSTELAREFEEFQIIQRIDGLDEAILVKLSNFHNYEIAIFSKMLDEFSTTDIKKYHEKRNYKNRKNYRINNIGISKYLSDEQIIDIAKSDKRTVKHVKTDSNGKQYINNSTVSMHMKKVIDSFTKPEIFEIREHIDEYLAALFKNLNAQAS